MEIHVYDNKEKLTTALADWICNDIQRVHQNQEFYSWALSGGETPKSLYKMLAEPAFREKIDWNRIQIFWGDERVVPFTDERNNAKWAFDLMLNHVPIPKENIHIMRTDIEPKFAVDEYRILLKNYFQASEKTFDLALLGIGNDGHTLSIFPGSPLIGRHENWVNTGYNAEQQTFRITLMPDMINQSSAVVFMVEGKNKSKVLNEIINGEKNPNTLPAQLIQPENGNLHWFLDADAAESLAQ